MPPIQSSSDPGESFDLAAAQTLPRETEVKAWSLPHSGLRRGHRAERRILILGDSDANKTDSPGRELVYENQNPQESSFLEDAEVYWEGLLVEAPCEEMKRGRNGQMEKQMSMPHNSGLNQPHRGGSGWGWMTQQSLDAGGVQPWVILKNLYIYLAVQGLSCGTEIISWHAETSLLTKD